MRYRELRLVSDLLLQIGASRPARRLLKTIGLPLPLPAPLRRAEGAWEARPLAGRRIVVAAARDSSQLALPVADALLAAGAELGERNGEAELVDGLVFDASSLRAPADLRAVFDFFQPAVRKLGPNGRVLVLGRPANEARSAIVAAAQNALEGFVRSLAKEIGKKGATAALVLVAAGAEAELAPLLRFVLSERSAFITGQVLSIEPRGASVRNAPLVRPLENKVALVTGAARGIGQATARLLAAEGAHVVCLDRPQDSEAVASVAQEIGGSSLALDVGEGATGQVIAAELANRHGGVDIVVHNAGITRDKTLARMISEHWDQAIDVNLSAVIRIDDALSAVLREAGRVICLASIAGIAGTVGQTNYAAAKAGLIGFAKRRAQELAARGVTVNAVAPGLIETRLTAAMPVFVREAGRRFSALAQGGQPRDVAEAVTFLASPGAAGINGSVLRVCGGAFLGA